MQIEQANILLNGQRKAVQKTTVKESLKAWVGQRPATAEEAGSRLPAQPGQGATEISLSDEGRAAAKTARADKPADDADDTIADPKLRMIKLLFERLYSMKFDVLSLDDEAAETDPPAANSWGVEYDYHETYYEAEQTSISASGLIKTADGQEVEFTLNLSMSREFMTEKEQHLRLGNAAKDPLVINFDGTAAQLSNTKFLFDLDIDGRAEQISFAGPNSGFLALDRNEDGRINNGSELFGPNTGHGFAELAAYDEDRNQWLDEKDPVFTRLRIWTKDGQGADQLASLADKGVGAIYLKPISSEFSLKDSQNQFQGQVRSTSVYLGENGSAGTVQQVDLAV